MRIFYGVCCLSVLMGAVMRISADDIDQFKTGFQAQVNNFSNNDMAVRKAAYDQAIKLVTEKLLPFAVKQISFTLLRGISYDGLTIESANKNVTTFVQQLLAKLIAGRVACETGVTQKCEATQKDVTQAFDKGRSSRDQEVRDLQTKIAAISAQLPAKFKEGKDSQNQEITNLQEQIAQLNTEKTNLQEKLAELEVEKKALQSQVAEIPTKEAAALEQGKKERDPEIKLLTDGLSKNKDALAGIENVWLVGDKPLKKQIDGWQTYFTAGAGKDINHLSFKEVQKQFSAFKDWLAKELLPATQKIAECIAGARKN